MGPWEAFGAPFFSTTQGPNWFAGYGETAVYRPEYNQPPMTPAEDTRIVRCWHCKGMMKVPRRALSVFCPHCQKRASLEDLVIVGSHPGKSLVTCGNIRIEPTAKLHVEVQAHRVVVNGRIKGPITASESVEVGPTGHVIGDIRAPRIVVQEGARIEGRCEMIRLAPVPTTATTASLPTPVPIEENPELQIPGINLPKPRPLMPPRLRG